MRGLAAAAVLIVAGTGLTAQQIAKGGAKSLFFDTQTGKTVMPTVPMTDTSGKKTRVPAITGLMYYFELISPNGELVRVNSNRVFHTGDKVRLHVSSNTDGRLTIFQSQDGGGFERLLPPPDKPGPVVRKGVDTLLPSAAGWFKFDNRPGEIRLLIMLTAEPSGPAMQNAATETPGRMHAIAEAQGNSKGLVVESGDSPKEAFEVRVVNSAQDRSLPPGQIVVELRLQHSPRV